MENHPASSQSGRRVQRKRRRCLQCGSRKFSRDAHSGQLVCQEGHVLHGYQEELAFEDGGGEEFVGPTTRKRRLRKNRGTKRDKITKRANALDDIHAGFRGYQALQLILRLQLASLRNIYPRLPHDRLEAVAIEFWTLFLHLSEQFSTEFGTYALRAAPIVDPIGLDELDTATESDYHSASSVASGSQSGRSDRSMSRNSFRARSRSSHRSISLGATTDAESTGPEDALNPEAGPGIQFDLQRRLRGSRGMGGGDYIVSDLGSHRHHSAPSRANRSGKRKARSAPGSEREVSDDDRSGSSPSEDDGTEPVDRERVRQVGRLHRTDLVRRRLIYNTLSIIYLSFWVLRIPLPVPDIRQLLLEKRVPFLTAVDHLPKELIRQLPYEALDHFGLDAAVVPSAEAIYARAQGFATEIARVYHVALPQFNATPLLWTFIRKWLLPPSAYLAAKGILIASGTSMHLIRAFANASAYGYAEAHEETYPPDKRPRTHLMAVQPELFNIHKEVSLIAAIIVVMKMRYGLDGDAHIDHSNKTLAGMPQWDHWVQAIVGLTEQHEALTAHHADAPIDPLDMTEDDLDRFLQAAEEWLPLRNENLFLKHRHRKLGTALQSFDAGYSSMGPECEPTNHRVELRQSDEALSQFIHDLFSKTLAQSRYGGTPAEEDDKREPSAAFCHYELPTHAQHQEGAGPDVADGVLPGDYQLVLDFGARMAGCTPRQMESAVWRMEKSLNLRRFVPRNKRKEDSEHPVLDRILTGQ